VFTSDICATVTVIMFHDQHQMKSSSALLICRSLWTVTC